MDAQYSFILLPGLDGTGLLFAPFLEKLPSTLDAEVIEYPDDEFLDYDQLADLVRGQLPESKKIVILAESFSGPVAARLLDHPHIAGVIFCASFLTPPRPLLLALLSNLPLTWLLRIPIPTFALRAFCFGTDCSAANISLFRQTLKRVQPRVLAHRIGLLSGMNDLGRIRETPCPLGYLKPQCDRLVPAARLAELEAYCPSIVVKEVEGPHFLLQASPNLAWDVVELLIKEWKMAI